MNYESIELTLRRRIPYFDLKDKQNEKRKIKKKLMQFNNFLSSYGLGFESIEIKRMNPTKKFTLNISEGDLPSNDKAAICQKAREISLMSEKSYLKFRKIISPIAKLPSLKKCNAFKKQINQIWPLNTEETENPDPEDIYNPSESNRMGASIAEPLEKIKFVCSKYLNKLTSQTPKGVVVNDTFKIMICGDGIQITKTHLNLLNICFTLLNDGDLSHKGLYTLGIFKIKNESYESIKKCLKHLIDKLRVVSAIEINNQTYQIEFYAGGDLKWLSNCFGINAANSKYPCPFCTFEMQDIMTSNDVLVQNWPITRNHNEALNSIHMHKADGRKGYINPPIFDFIDFDKIVVDILHLFLRITDKLFELLLRRLQTLDDPSGDNKKPDIDDWPLTKSFLDYVEIKCNVTSPFYFKEKGTDHIIKLRKLNQNERLSIFNNMGALDQIYPEEIRNDTDILRLTRLFTEFKDIMEQISRVYVNNFNMKTKVELSTRLKKWLRDYIRMEPKITPYIHIFVYHIPDLIERHKNLNLFSMQGMEKSNHFAKINFFRQTNHQKNGFTTTLLEKLNRIEYFHLVSNEY